MYSRNTFIPTKGCSHAYGMIFEPDFCCCTKCEQKWVWTDSGWKAVPASWMDGDGTDTVSTPKDPYKRFQARPGARLKPKVRVKR